MRVNGEDFKEESGSSWPSGQMPKHFRILLESLLPHTALKLIDIVIHQLLTDSDSMSIGFQAAGRRPVRREGAGFQKASEVDPFPSA